MTKKSKTGKTRSRSSVIKRNKRVGSQCEQECVLILTRMSEKCVINGIAYRYVIGRSYFQPIDVIGDYIGKKYFGFECKHRSLTSLGEMMSFDDISSKGADGRHQIEHQCEYL